jgi:hypothetical protein
MQPKIKPDAPDSPLDQAAFRLKNSDDGHRNVGDRLALFPTQIAAAPIKPSRQLQSIGSIKPSEISVRAP